ncbi:MAG: biopolymer transporter ExbD [Wenzhouxiangellaceae bacterium]|nr:biopolymer transporter ExbD [Wenzhouxiangellaceae bacterium]MBS3745843.1 biopolymer transporter ExbD [Wenzhouxiangellaceae bacterium]MBS3824266.1 biopolymer transporter ExbD [Wenzhouxiangellaceae bacterium]
MARRHATRDEPEINITPMLDIVFIMLIFFIVTTTFIKETGVTVEKPDALTAESRPQGNILVGVDSDDRIWMNGNQIELGDVRTLVQRSRAENPEGSVILIADQEARQGTLVDVMDQVQAAGVRRMAISAEQVGGGG